MNTYMIRATYGSQRIICDCYVLENRNGSKWYVIDGSVNVNCTYDELTAGTDLEQVQDCDMFTWSSPIYSEEQLEYAVNY